MLKILYPIGNAID